MTVLFVIPASGGAEWKPKINDVGLLGEKKTKKQKQMGGGIYEIFHSAPQDLKWNSNTRVGPDSSFALLSPVLGSEIPFEKGFFENPFSPSRNTTFCPVLGPHGPFAEPSINFMCVFRKILVPNLIDNYYLRRFIHHRILPPSFTYC